MVEAWDNACISTRGWLQTLSRMRLKPLWAEQQKFAPIILHVNYVPCLRCYYYHYMELLQSTCSSVWGLI